MITDIFYQLPTENARRLLKVRLNRSGRGRAGLNFFGVLLTRIAEYDIVATNIATWRNIMKFANVRELKNKTSEILRNAEKEAVIITSKGKPRALVTAISEEDFEDYLLEKSAALHDMLAEAQAEYYSKGGVSLENYLSKRKKKSG